jgi:hypothetical protein
MELVKRSSESHLFELVDTEDTPRILSVGTGFFSVARAVSSIPICASLSVLASNWRTAGKVLT